MIVKKLSSNELYHHGVQGQKWGVRNGPPYPIEDKILRKGERLNSVAAVSLDQAASLKDKDFNKKIAEAYKKSGRWMYTYNKNNKWDNKVYKGPFSIYKIRSRGAKAMAEFQYEVIGDLKMPTRKERVDEFKNLYKDKRLKKKMSNELNSMNNMLIMYKVGNQKEQAAYKKMQNKFNNIKTEEEWNTAYSVFNHMMESVQSYKTTMEYAKRMSKKYDAMVDDNNQSIYNRAQDPVIIFRANEALKAIGDVKIIEVNEIMNNYNDVKKELNKHGENVKL